MNQQFWDTVNKHISRGQLKEAISKLEGIKNLSSDRNNDIISLSGRLSGLERDKRNGIINSNNYNIETNTLRSAILSLIPEIKEDLVDQESNNQDSSNSGNHGSGNGRTNNLGNRSNSNSNSSASEVTKILFLSANPDSTGRLKLDQEYRDIDEGLKRAQHRKSFDLVSRWAVRPIDLRRSLIEEMPKILHFAGHGETYRDQIEDSSQPEHSDDPEEIKRKLKLPKKEEDPKEAVPYTGGIVLVGDDGSHKLVAATALGSLIRLANMKAKIDCVILNACYSAVQATEIIKHAKYVIGMNNSISDRAAIIFSVAFYDALGAGEEIPFAFELGKVAIELEGLKGSDIPVLHSQED